MKNLRKIRAAIVTTQKMDNQSQTPVQLTPQLSNMANKALWRFKKAQECLRDTSIVDEIQAVMGKGQVEVILSTEDNMHSNNSTSPKQTSTNTISEQPSANEELMDRQETMANLYLGNNQSLEKDTAQ
jgi:hypothetical protein